MKYLPELKMEYKAARDARPYALAFILTMPNCGSWNGRWSGEGNLYCILKPFKGSKRREEKYRELVAKRDNFHYSWNDGWGANVTLKIVSAEQARKMKKASRGFAGYDWMVSSIMEHGEILANPPRAIS